MRKLILALAILIIANLGYSKDIILTGKDAAAKIQNAETIRFKENLRIPSYVKFRKGQEIKPTNFANWFLKLFGTNKSLGLKISRTDTDKFGFIHHRFQITYISIPLEFAVIIAHEQNGNIISFTGFVPDISYVDMNASLNEKQAFEKALEYVPAELYKWQVSGEERFIKMIKNNTSATYFPNAELVVFPSKEIGLRLAYKLNIYAHKPLKRVDIYVDAVTGKKLLENNQIQNSDVTGSAVTKYSGTQTITTDSYNGSFRLREVGRGNGIETYDMNVGSDYGAAVDFTDADNNWNNYNAELDEVATDAHWATEKTYDYFKNIHSRNSIDDAGFALRSYVHADLVALGLGTNTNAFWDGNVMTYGDGGGNIPPLTALDICGHEITHGLNTFSANLNYGEEPGALNEGFSDIFGTCIEFYAKPTDANWTVGEDVNMIIRSLENPSSTNNPDTYQGQNWDFNQEVHKNSTIVSHWFYLLSVGGSGTNDNGDSYSVTGITIDSAALIAFRTLTYYLTNTSDYADTRFNSIVAAIDIFGPCSPEVEAVTNAWYAVGVGNAYVPQVISDFSADFTAFCSAPATVNFSNFSNNATSFIWYFGDGSTGFDLNPTHVYNTNGTFTVSLVTNGGSCGSDTLTIPAYISINSANPCVVIMPTNGSSTVTYCIGELYDSGGMSNYQDQTDVTVTIAPPGASQVVLTFTSFDFESGYDYLYVYDGPNISSTLIGQYDGSTLPNGGTIISSFGSITLRQTSDQAVTGSGFALSWQCQTPSSPPAANFFAESTSSCTGEIVFNDYSSNNPNAWNWDFGDGTFSTESAPVHYYSASGIYTVTLISTNQFGSDTVIKTNYISIDLAEAPIVNPDTICSGEVAHLSATGTGTVNWYSSATGGSPIYTGEFYDTPNLISNTTYFVENELLQVSQFVGKTDNAGAGGYYTNATEHYMIFDVFEPITLISVKVYANTAGVRTINLKNSQGTIIETVSPNFPQGESRITLNFQVQVGTNYQLAISPGNCNLYRNGSQNGTPLPYPYQIANLVSIKNNSASNLVYYYYFYDWEVIGTTCISARVPVTAVVENCTAIPEYNSNIVTQVFPNPASDYLYFSIPTAAEQPIIASISNASGKIVRKIVLDKNNVKISIENLADGLYFVRLQHSDFVEVLKFIILK